MPRIPKPWFREDRNAYFVTIRGERHKCPASVRPGFSFAGMELRTQRAKLRPTDGCTA